jgi:hypothetical protein
MKNVKYCPGCERTLGLCEFNFEDGAKGGPQVYCRVCTRQVRGHNRRNRAKYRARARDARENQEVLERVLRYLECHPCVRCGEADPVVLEFDHIDPSPKQREIGAMISGGFSWRKIQAEIDKCAVLCVNCHRRRTAQRFGWYRLRLDFRARSSTG